MTVKELLDLFKDATEYDLQATVVFADSERGYQVATDVRMGDVTKHEAEYYLDEGTHIAEIF